ncbi:MAG: hypothetical protein WBW84_21955 [Acidobacteriaceae bacterium]
MRKTAQQVHLPESKPTTNPVNLIAKASIEACKTPRWQDEE